MTAPLIRTEGGERLRELAREFRRREDGRELRRELTKELRPIANRIVTAERAAVRRLPSKGQSAARGRPSLRRKVARATQARVRTSGRNAGVSVRVNPKRMPPGEENLPAYLEGVLPRWRHPVFGDTDRWVQQGRPLFAQRAKPWFYATADQHTADAWRAAERALDRFADRIERG